jgi:hypothetical protein
MSSRVMPYRTPSEDRVVAGPWMLLEGPVYRPLADQPPPWDYTTDLAVRREVTVDLGGTLTDCGLPEDAQILLAVRARSDASLIRRTVLAVPVTRTGPVVLEAVVPGADLAASVLLETVLELGQDVPVDEPFVPNAAGSLLWRDALSVPLEGGGGLMPLAPVSFAEAGLPSAAAWYLDLGDARWDNAALGTLLVLLNTDNTAVVHALEEPDDPAAGTLMSALEADVVADLVGRALDDEEFREAFLDPDVEPPMGDSDGGFSLGALVVTMLRSYLSLPGETVADAGARLLDLRRVDPSRFRAFVQQGVRFPRSAA